MSDLISRSALLELFQKRKAGYEADHDATGFLDSQLMFGYLIQELDELEEIIADIPTAFDLDKVVQQLEEVGKLQITAHSGRCNGKTLTLGYVKGIENAIEIVRKGGVE